MSCIFISDKIKHKLDQKHGVSPHEVEECFANLDGKFLNDRREDHLTDPPTKWFISETNRGRKLKVAFVFHPGGKVELKTAYSPNEQEERIYEKHGYA